MARNLDLTATMPSNTAPVAARSGRPRTGRAADIRATLQQEIETGVMVPGTSLDERALAERFGVSRTPVREALQQLAAHDLVRIAPRHGVSVARLSITQVRSMLEYIGELEALCAKLAARRLDNQLSVELDNALARCKEAVEREDFEGYGVANQHFHEIIYNGSRNVYLADNLRWARRFVQRYHVSYFQTAAQVAKSLADHVKVTRAIQAGDEDAAAQAMLMHVPIGTTGFSEFLATVPMTFFDPEPGPDSAA